jgi:aminopeptidase N
MKDALDYCTANFSPFQFRQLRILEFPRYQTFAQSYANTIPYSEGIGFILKIKHPEKDLDMAYYVTAHEAAHQWWGQQVIEADTKGSEMLSEGMSQYSALMVMKHSFPAEIVERYLKYELDNYLRGRTIEKRNEAPLVLVEHQPHVFYNKSSLIFFALQDYIGEDNLNRAFSAFNKQWAFKDAPYPTSYDLLKEIHKVTPDSLLYILHDMFETVTLFENQALDAVYKEVKKGKFELTLSVSCEKILVDTLGRENNIPIDDWIDVGFYSTDSNGKEKLIYLKKHKINKKNNLFVISIGEKPNRAGIDPLHKLIDRHSDDNTTNVGQFIEITNLPVEY